jgi:hypothetical protein
MKIYRTLLLLLFSLLVSLPNYTAWGQNILPKNDTIIYNSNGTIIKYDVQPNLIFMTTYEKKDNQMGHLNLFILMENYAMQTIE